MVIPRTQYTEFCRLWKLSLYKGLRFGQAFYQYMKFEKTTDPDVEVLYYADYETCRNWIESRLDHEN